MSKNELAHMKHRDPQGWKVLDVSARWAYDMGWHDAVAFLIKREFNGETVETESEQPANQHSS